MKKIISMLLLLFMVAGFMPVYADPLDDGGNSGGGSGGGGVSGSTWREQQSGYRITVVDKNKRVVATVVDFVYSKPNQYFGSGDKYWYTNSRFTGASSSANNYSYYNFGDLIKNKQIDSVPHYPIYTDKGKLNAGGEYFKEWFLAGAYGMDFTQVPQKPKPTPSSPKNVETGTSRPVPGSFEVEDVANHRPTGYVRGQDQTGGYVGSSIVSNVAQRRVTQADAYIIVVKQGYIKDASASISILSSNAMTQFKRLRATKSYEVAVRETINNIVSLSKIYGRTTAEQNYILAVTLDKFLGAGRTIDTSNLRTYTFNNEGLQLDQVPAAGDKNYYIDEVMNSKVNGKYVFQFNGVGVTAPEGMNTSTDPLEFIQRNNFYVMVEPIFWFKPAQSAKKGSKYVKTNEQSYYVYGTVKNLTDHYKDVLGWNIGYFYQSLTNGIGWSSMYMGNDWVDADGNVLLKGLSLSGDFSVGVKNHDKMREWYNNNYAIATHVYRSSIENTQVTGFPNWNTPTAAPDPKDLKVKSGDTKKYNIVKYYEEEENGVVVHRYAPLYRTGNPPGIEIVDELTYYVQDWFITGSDVKTGAPATYAGAKGKYARTQTGRKPKSVRLNDSELTLVVLLSNEVQDTGSAPPEGYDFSVEIPESKISVNASTASNISITKLRNYTLPSFGRSLNYVLKNITEIDAKVEANTSKWKPSMTGNTVKGNGGTLANPRYDTLLHRGYDDLTLYSPYVTETSPLRGIFNRYGISPGGDRGLPGVYKVPVTWEFSLRDTVGLTDVEKGSLTGIPVNGAAIVKTYRGVRDGKAIGKVYDEREKTGLGLTVAGLSGNNGVGKMIQNETRIQFYPYIRMTYQEPGSTTEKDAYVTSQWVSVVEPNDFVEVNWGRAGVQNLNIASNQWSLHARAINGGQSWNGQNQVLPGGAIYDISSLNTAVGVVTWQTIMTDEVRNKLAVEIAPNEYTLTRATAAHNGLVDQARAKLEGLEIYQWVNGDPNATTAWTNNGKAVKVEPGVSLSPLGLRTKAAMDTKYQLNGDSASNRKLEILNSGNNENTYFKVFSDTSGNVYLAKAVGNVELLKDVNGFKLSKSGVQVTKLIGKNVKADAVAGLLSGDAKALDERTKLITNFVTALERNTGNDTSASWASDGKWYNEAFDGIYVVRQQTNIQVGFSGKKVLALDPNLTPASSGKADLYTKAFVSQYKADIGGSDVLGNFKGVDIRLQNMGDIFSSKKFYIPNALVTDGY